MRKKEEKNKTDEEIKIKITISTVEQFDDLYLDSIINLLKLSKKMKEEEPDRKSILYTIPIIMLCISFLESFINYIFFMFQQNPKHKDFENINTKLINDLWKDFDWDKASVLDKYSFLLKYDKGEHIKGFSPYENVKKVVKLRNILIHSRPFFVSSEEEEDNKIVQVLENEFEISTQRTSFNYRHIPYLDYNCACWAVHCTLGFFADCWHRLLPTKTTLYYKKLEEIINNHPAPPKPKNKKQTPIKKEFVIYKEE